MTAALPAGYWGLVGLLACLPALVLLLMRRRLRRAQAAERLAAERRDRFLAVAARELESPLQSVREQLAGLDAWSATPARIGTITRQLDQLRDMVSELGHLPGARQLAERCDIDLAELLRDILAQPPFSEEGPSVILRAAPTTISADRARLTTGLRVLLWVVRREVAEHASLVVSVSRDHEAASIEIDSGGTGVVADALERLPAIRYGLAAPREGPGTLLALQVAHQVAHAHGGRLSASARAGKGERLVLQLPVGTLG